MSQAIDRKDVSRDRISWKNSLQGQTPPRRSPGNSDAWSGRQAGPAHEWLPVLIVDVFRLRVRQELGE